MGILRRVDLMMWLPMVSIDPVAAGLFGTIKAFIGQSYQLGGLTGRLWQADGHTHADGDMRRNP